MNLLEHIKQHLDDPKKKLAIQLLNKPWNTDLQVLREHVPKPLYDRFSTIRNEILIRLNHIGNGPLPYLWGGTKVVAIRSYGPPGPDDSKDVANGYYMHWVDQIQAQIVEDLEKDGRASGRLGETDQAAFVLLYTVAHACVFVLAKLLVVTDQGRYGFSLGHNPDAESAHRLYWFAHYLSSLSTMSDHLQIYNAIQSASRVGRPMHAAFHASSDALATCRDYFADKFLSLHPDYVHLIHEDDQDAVRAMTERLGLIVHIYICSVRHQVDAGTTRDALRLDRLLAVEIDVGDLHRAGFSDGVINEFIDECMRQPVGDRFLMDIGGGRLQMGDISLKYAMQTHCHSILSRMNYRGDWFEQDYIANYIRERIPSTRYRVFRGIKDEAKKYDADAIIEDMQTGALLFCQMKHRTEVLLPHLRDEMTEYMRKTGQIEKGQMQLKNLRDLIGSDGVLERVKQVTGNRKLSAQSLTDRAKYLLIHNIENLDFCTGDGIAMYEWNTLRNLMRGTMNTVTKEGVVSTSSSIEDLDLGNPHQVMKVVCSWMEASHPKDQAPSVLWGNLRKSQLRFLARNSLNFKRFHVLPWSTFGFELPVI